MTIAQWLAAATQTLRNADVPVAELDASVLLCDILGNNRAWILAHPEFSLTTNQVAELDHLITRRAHHEPLAYIRNKVEFYGREFFVDKAVLVPRPESETIIELVKKIAPSDNVSITDVGTGSGALGITAALELMAIGKTVRSLTLIDIDPACLQIARRNCSTYQLEAQFVTADLLHSAKPTDIVLCNLPYVPDSHTINSAAMIEPKIAIFGGDDGLDLYRTLFTQLQNAHTAWHPRYVVTESLPFQHESLAHIAAAAGFQLEDTDDFIQAFSPKP